MEFAVNKFAAWAPDKQNPDAWRQWVKGGANARPDFDHNDKANKPKTSAIPAMTRRRLTSWGAMALEAACQCREDISEDTPTIFASRHGDTHRTYKLLENIAKDEALSPTAFSLSVHNSSSGMYSITQKLFGPALAIAAGKETFAHALLEAENLLFQNHKKVLLVMCDEPLADFYKAYQDECEQAHAFAMVLSKSTHEAQTSLKVSRVHSLAETTANTMSLSMQFLAYWYSENAETQLIGPRNTWSFSRTIHA